MTDYGRGVGWGIKVFRNSKDEVGLKFYPGKVRREKND